LAKRTQLSFQARGTFLASFWLLRQHVFEIRMSPRRGTKKLYPIGELMEEFGVTNRALRFYEERGLLKPIRVSNTRSTHLKFESASRRFLKARRLV